MSEHRSSSTREATSDQDSGSDSSGNEDTAVRPGLAERIQAKLASATDTATAKDEDAQSTRGGSSSKSLTSSNTTDTAPSDSSGPRKPRRARLRLTRVDPWSVMKTAFLLSIAFGVVTVVAVGMIWSVLGAAGVWDSINSTIQESLGSENSDAIDVEDYVGTSRVIGFSMLVAAVDVILITAIATLSAFLYNMSAALLGGVEVTLAEDAH